MKTKRRNAHQSLFFGNRTKQQENNANVISNDDFEVLRRKLSEQHDDITLGSDITRTSSSSIIIANKKIDPKKIKKNLNNSPPSAPEWGPVSPPTSPPAPPPPQVDDNPDEQAIHDMKREIASMLESLDFEYGETPSAPTSALSASLRDLDDEHDDFFTKNTAVVGVGPSTSLADLSTSPSTPITSSSTSPNTRFRSSSISGDRKMSLEPGVGSPNSLRKRGLGSVVGGFRKSIMMRTKSAYHSDMASPFADEALSPFDSPRKSTYEARYEQYKNFESGLIVEEERKRLKELRQFSPQMVLHGFYREGKLNDMYFRTDVFYEKKENTLVSFAKALNK
jgi:hypothetical protein